MAYQKKPKKGELLSRIASLENENRRLIEKQEKSQQEEWEKNTPKATSEFLQQITRIFGGLACCVRFEHVDASGYWFSFELINDARRQNYCVRHSEAK